MSHNLLGLQCDTIQGNGWWYGCLYIWERETATLILIHNRSRAGLASREVGDARERQAGIRVWRHVLTYSSRPHESLLYAYYESSQQSTQEHKWIIIIIIIINLSSLFPTMRIHIRPARALLELINHDTRTYIRVCLRHHAMQGLYLSLRVSLWSSLNPPQWWIGDDLPS